MNTSKMTQVDVIVIGAGMAGIGVVHNLQRQGISALVIDHKEPYPDAFRAEKIEPDQAVLMKKLGMFDYRVPQMEPIGYTINYRDGRRTNFDTIEQYGINYGDTINSLRKHLLNNDNFKVSKIHSITNTSSRQTVILGDGTEISAKLIVIATGGASQLLKKFDLSKRPNRSLVTFNVGFYIKPGEGNSFEFNGFNYYLDRKDLSVDYMTLFKIGDSYRVNIFAQWRANERDAKAMRSDTLTEIKKYFPSLEKEIGVFEIASKIQFFFTEFYRLKNIREPGIVIIGDEYQSVCPATGTGLSKVFTDTDVLCHKYIPRWIEQDEISERDTRNFYNDEVKLACDQDSLNRWVYYRDSKYGYLRNQWSRIDSGFRTLLNAW